MITNSVKIRWINGQCFEIKLSNGKTILTDPMFRDPLPGISRGAQYKIPGFSIDDIEGADYIIINHTHGDHIIDLGVVAKKFDSTVITGSPCAYAIAKRFGLLPTRVYPIDGENTYFFPDFKLQTFHGMHNHLLSPLGYDKAKGTLGVEGLVELGDLGSIFNYNYVITTNENLKIGFSAGDYFDDTVEKWKGIDPNIVLRHRCGKGPKAAPFFANVLEKTHAQLLFPMHHEDWLFSDPDYVDSVMDEVNCIMEEKNLYGRAEALKRTKWYTITLGNVLVE